MTTLKEKAKIAKFIHTKFLPLAQTASDFSSKYWPLPKNKKELKLRLQREYIAFMCAAFDQNLIIIKNRP